MLIDFRFSIRLGFLWFGYGLTSFTLLSYTPDDIVGTIDAVATKTMSRMVLTTRTKTMTMDIMKWTIRYNNDVDGYRSWDLVAEILPTTPTTY